MNFLSKNSESVALLCFGSCGLLLYAHYQLLPVSMLLFFLGVVFCLYSVGKAIFALHSLSTSEVGLIVGFIVFALSHMVGLFLPETGFDALWYHLPITQVFIHLHANVFIPQLYQSAMPRLGSFMFVIPFLIAHEPGVKVFCFLVTLLLPVLLYKIARQYLPRNISLLCALLFFSLHTVAWQASSGYVDQIRAAFELAVVLLALEAAKKKSLISLMMVGTLLGFSWSTKLVSLFFLPAFVIFLLNTLKLKKTCLLLSTALLVALPWYLQAYVWTGNPLYPLFQLLDGTAQLREMGVSSWQVWLGTNVIKFGILPIYLTLHQESLTTPLFAFSFPYLLISAKKLFTQARSLMLLCFIGFLVWFFIPPLSIRYALSFVGIGLVLSIFSIWERVKRTRLPKQIFYLVCGVSLSLSLGLRLGANLKAVPVFTGQISQQEYLKKNTPGIAEGPTQLWYSGYWKSWEPSTQTQTHP